MIFFSVSFQVHENFPHFRDELRNATCVLECFRQRDDLHTWNTFYAFGMSSHWVWFWFVHQMQNTCGAYVPMYVWMHKAYTYTIINGPLPRPGCDFSFFRLQSGVTLKHNGMRFHKSVQKSGRINMKTHIWHWNEIEQTTTALASACTCTTPKYQCHLKCFLFGDFDVIVWLLKSRLMVHSNYDIPKKLSA